MKVQKGFGFGGTFKEKKKPKTKTTMAMHCLKCDTIFYTMHFGPENSADACECRNIKIGIRPFSRGVSYGRATHFLTVTVDNREKMKLYSVYRKNLKRVQPEKDY
jgi:hypothetical protein